jgi:2-methylisocitrate lyase-like PEP mutase family enzyme
MRSQAEKGRLFRELHARPGILILPNPWDAGTAKLLASLGFEALATTSLGMANALGRVDAEGSVSRAELLENCRVIAGATDLPVNADLENGYADDPKEAASILRDAAEMGVVGGSIEDWSGERIYDFDHAVERVAAGVEVARSLPVPFTFVARAENLSAAGSISMIRSGACRPSKRPAPMCCTRPGYAIWPRCAPSPSRSASR